MTNAVKEILCDSIIHIDIGIRRFAGNEDLYEKNLRQFPNDTLYTSMMSAMKAGSIREAEGAAQLLKQKAYNLGMVRLAKSCDVLCEAIRQGRGLPDFPDEVNEVSAVYNVMNRCLAKAFPAERKQ